MTRLELCSPIGYGPDFALARGRQGSEEDPGRSWHEGREFALHHGRAAEEPGEEHCVGEGSRHHADDHRDPGRRERREPPDARPGESRRPTNTTRSPPWRRRPACSKACTTRASKLSMVDGKRTYDLLFDLLDPELVKFQFQMSTITAGLVAADYFLKYPGRFYSMHLQDIDMNAPGTGRVAGRATRGATPAGCARPRQHRLGQDLHRREGRRGQELLRRAKLGTHAAECRLSEEPGGVIAVEIGCLRVERHPGVAWVRGGRP